MNKIDTEHIKLGRCADTFTYVLCPDSACDLFFSSANPIPCKRNQFAVVQCPHLDDVLFMLYCSNCGEEMVYKNGRSDWRRIDHKCGGSELGKQCAGKYRLVRVNDPPNTTANPFENILEIMQDPNKKIL